MPAPFLAAVLALGALLTTPSLFRSLPAPPEASDLNFGDLLNAPFSGLVFTGVFGFGWLALGLTDPALWPIWAPFVVFGVWLGLVDAQTTFLPNRLVYLALAAAWLGTIASCLIRGDAWPLLWAGIGTISGGALFWLIWRFTHGGIGFGDVRLAALLGTIGGASHPELLLWIYLLGTTIGALWAVGARLRGLESFAYGPALLLGAPAALVMSAALGPSGTF